MVIKRSGRILAVLLAVMTLIPVLSCCGQSSEQKTQQKGSTTSDTTEEALGERCHFSNFNIYVPEGWSGKGNSGKLYTPEVDEGEFLLINKGNDPEQDAKEQLTLFFGTEYYVDEMAFSYTYDEAVKHGRQVEGTVQNGRNGTETWFTGFYLTEPSCYFLFFCKDAEEVISMRILADNCYETLENLE